jgi:hypothetical protein
MSAAVRMNSLLPVSDCPGVPVRVLDAPSKVSHAGCPDKL